MQTKMKFSAKVINNKLIQVKYISKKTIKIYLNFVY